MKSAKKGFSSLKIKRQALYILIFSFVTVVVWISGSLFRSQRRTGIAPDLLELAKPLSPTINVSLIDEIEDKNNFSVQDLSNFQIYKLIQSKDGRIQQVVPIDYEADEISQEEVNLLVREEVFSPPESTTSSEENF